MRKSILTLPAISFVLAFSLHATIGETGPIGWINAAQTRIDGSYSRGISAFVLLIGVCLIVMGGIYVIEFFPEDPAFRPWTRGRQTRVSCSTQYRTLSEATAR